MDPRRDRFEAVVLPHLDAAYRFARWLVRVPADAEDIVQDAVLRAYRGFDGLRDADAKGWLLAIVRNCHATAHRRQARRGFVTLPDEHAEDAAWGADSADHGPESEAIRAEHARTLERLLADLPEEQREVLILREIEDLDYRQIAAVTQVPIGTVMSRLARARGALKARWSTRIGSGA